MEPWKRTKGDDDINRSEMNESLRNAAMFFAYRTFSVLEKAAMAA